MSASAELTQDSLKSVLIYDSSGHFIWLCNRPGGAKSGDTAGYTNGSGRSQVNVFGKRYQVSHLVWLYFYGIFPHFEIDHIDGNCSNNRIENLRDVDHRTNLENRNRVNKRASGRSSTLLGVSWKKDRSKWVANIGTLGATKHLGYFDSESSAHAAYLSAKREIHQGNTL